MRVIFSGGQLTNLERAELNLFGSKKNSNVCPLCQTSKIYYPPSETKTETENSSPAMVARELHREVHPSVIQHPPEI